jgi:hypothetical protein
MTNKNILNVFIFLVISGFITSCSKICDWNRFGLKGKVKVYFEKHYKPQMKFGQWENGDVEYFGHNKVSFDSDGNYQWIDYLDSDFKLLGKVIPSREKGEILDESYYDYEGKLFSKTNFTTNSNNELELSGYDKDGNKIFQGKSIFKNGRIHITENQTFKDGKIVNELKITFEYDNDGNLISQKHTNKSGKIMYYTKYKYLSFDKYNNWIKRLDYDSENGKEPKAIEIREYEYY